MRTERRCSRFTGGTYPWIVETTAMVNHYYFYCVDEDFGPFFLKFCSYFPYNAKLCINGNEYFSSASLPSGGWRSGAGQRRQVLCQPQADAAVVRRAVGGQDRSISAQIRCDACRIRFRHAIASPVIATSSPSCRPSSSLTQVLDQPVTRRIFFEEVIRENLDIGRPSQVSWCSTAR